MKHPTLFALIMGYASGILTMFWLGLRLAQNPPPMTALLISLAAFGDLGFIFSTFGIIIGVSKLLVKHRPNWRLSIALKNWADTQ